MSSNTSNFEITKSSMSIDLDKLNKQVVGNLPSEAAFPLRILSYVLEFRRPLLTWTAACPSRRFLFVFGRPGNCCASTAIGSVPWGSKGNTAEDLADPAGVATRATTAGGAAARPRATAAGGRRRRGPSRPLCRPRRIPPRSGKKSVDVAKSLN